MRSARYEAPQLFQFLNPRELPPARGYSHVSISSGRYVSIAGQVAVDSNGENVALGDFGAQAEKALQNVETALRAAGTDIATVTSLTIYCLGTVERIDLAALQRPLHLHFGDHPPPITLVFVHSLLDPRWLIEVQASAVLPLSA